MRKEHNLFNSCKNQELQAWNRCAVMFNLLKDAGREEMKRYANNFPDDDKERASSMFKKIKEHGYSTVRKEVMKNVYN